MKRLRFFIVSAFIAMSAQTFAMENIGSKSDSTMICTPQPKENAKPDWMKYLPTIKGTLRAKYEWSPQIGKSRFQLRNARIGFIGNVLENISYKVEIDVCDEGKIRVADAFAKLSLVEKQFAISAGFMRLPISMDANRGPSSQYFANRSFVGKYVGNVRDVGVRLGYHPTKLQLNIELGIYNGGQTETTKGQWNKTFIYVGRANYLFGGLKTEISFLCQRPDKIRMNSFDVALSWNYKNIFLEGEYMNKQYVHNSFKTVHAYNIMGHYRFPISKVLTHILLQGRWDSMTDYSDGVVTNEQGKLACTNPGRDRLTLGVTFGYIKKIGAEFRINYEKYFYHDDNVIASDNERDKLVAELVVKF